MSDYVTIPEAITLTGKSVSTIRRWVRKVVSDPDQSIVKKEPGITSEHYLIRRDALLKEFGEAEHEPVHANPVEDTHEDSHEQFMGILREQLQRQGEQLQKKDEQIAQLLERMREANILMNNYQQRLLSDPAVEIESKQEEAPSQQPPQQKTPSASATPSYAWAWLLSGVLVILLITLFAAYRDGLITLPWVR